jgi:hypothetical protein
MEFKLVLDDYEESLGNFKATEIRSLVRLLRTSRILDIDGNDWSLPNSEPLNFSVFPPYFFVTLVKED